MFTMLLRLSDTYLEAHWRRPNGPKIIFPQSLFGTNVPLCCGPTQPLLCFLDVDFGTAYGMLFRKMVLTVSVSKLRSRAVHLNGLFGAFFLICEHTELQPAAEPSKFGTSPKPFLCLDVGRRTSIAIHVIVLINVSQANVRAGIC